MTETTAIAESLNSQPFRNISRTNGRKVIRTSYKEVNRDNVAKIINDSLTTFKDNKMAIRYLWNYYKGDQPVRYREKSVRDDIVNKVVENRAYEIVSFKNGQTYGEPIQFISKKDDDDTNTAVDELNDYMQEANKQAIDIKAGEWQSATGTGCIGIFRKKGDIPFGLIAPTPLNTFFVYSEDTDELMLAVQVKKTIDNNEMYVAYSRNTEYTLDYSLNVIDEKLHAFADIPIIEVPNNWERISDIEIVIDLLDATNNLQSNRMDAVEQFVQSWVKFVNCEVDEDAFTAMKEMGALVVKSNNGAENKADVDILTQELDQTQSQIQKDDYWDSALSILAIPNKQTNTGGDSQGAVELRNGWDFSKSRAKLKDPLVRMAQKKLAKLVLNELRLENKALKLEPRSFDAQINHSPTDNMIVKAQSLQYLLQCGIHPLVALKTIGLWGDAEKVFLLSKPYMDNLWKTYDEAVEQGQEEEAQKLLDEQMKN